MPRLSIIVPYLENDAQFESTILSILENRSTDFELIIPHRGDFSDPYRLGGDEAVLIECSPSDSLITRINLATSAACSAVVETLLPGTVVQSGWAEAGLSLLSDSSVHAVCMPLIDPQTEAPYIGLDGRAIPHRRVTSSVNSCVGPLLCGGLLRRKTMCTLGGWFDHPMIEVAELELAILAEEINLLIECSPESLIACPKSIAVRQEFGFDIGKACGSLACAFASIPNSGIELDSIVRRLGHLATGLINPKTAAERLGWVLGIGDRSLKKSIHQRLEHATHHLATPVSIPIHGDRSKHASFSRRAA